MACDLVTHGPRPTTHDWARVFLCLLWCFGALPSLAQPDASYPHPSDPPLVALGEGALVLPDVENRERPQNAYGLNRSLSRVVTPTVQVHRPPDHLATGAAVVILPGGGFGRVVVDKEGHDVARWLAARGVAGIVLTYRTAGWYETRGAEDARAALAWARTHADAYGLDPDRIGLLGFSAGGYLALAAGTAPRQLGRPDSTEAAAFVALVYPVVPDVVGAWLRVPPPPLFAAHAADDAFAAEGSLAAWRAVHGEGVPAEVHVYADGGHGFGLGVHGGAVASWPDRLLGFLRTTGVVPPPPLGLLVLGDSNGASEHGWVAQLRALRPADAVVNVSVPGNTLGFDNLGNERLNTLRHLDAYLARADTSLPRVDAVLVALGTNDSKAVFDGRQDEVVAHLDTLVARVRAYPFDQPTPPEVVVLAPPPYGPDAVLAEKYQGGAARVAALAPRMEAVAAAAGARFVDVHTLLADDFAALAPDGVHMEAEGQRRIARAVAEVLVTFSPSP